LNDSYKSHLGYLMDALNISGRELASAIHTDVSLISKWKNKKRILNYRSPYFSDLVDYFLKVDQTNHYHILKRIFASQEEPIHNLTQLRHSVERFLMDDVSHLNPPSRESSLPMDPTRRVFDYPVRFFRGLEGAREAFEQILDMTVQSSATEKLLFFSQEDLKWLLKDSDFLHSWNNKILEILHQAHEFTLINGVNHRIFLEPESLKHWISFFTHHNVTTFSNNMPCENNHKLTLLIVRDKIVLYSVNYSSDPDDRYTAVYTDPFSVKSYTEIFKNYLKSSQPLFIPFPLARLDGLREKLEGYIREPNNYFIYSFMPNLIHFPPELIVRVLQRHRIQETHITRILEFQAELNALATNSIKILYNIDLYNQLGNLDQIRIETLSYLAGQPVHITRPELREIFESIKEKMRSDSLIQFAFIQEADISLLFPVNLIIASRKFVVTYNPVATREYFLGTDLTTTVAFEYYFDHLWNQVPLIQKNPLYVMDTLDKLIDAL